MAVKEEKKEAVDIADFFTTTRSKEGIWYEPKIDGIGIGIEFKILGPAADETVKATEAYNKAHDKALAETDMKASVESERHALAARAADIITDVRAKGGKVIVCNKKEFKATKDELKTVMYENEDICLDLLLAAGKSVTFMKKR